MIDTNLPARAATTLRLAEATIGAVHIGIPADAVVQAMAAPDAPSVLPRRQGALCGIVDYNGMLVPVVDLARWVDVGSAPAGAGKARARILILRDGARVIGLQVNSVGGLVDIDAGSARQLHRDDGPEEVFHSVARSPDSGRILSLLDVDRLATLAAAWSDDGATLEVAAPAPEAAPTTVPYALLRAGALRLGVAAGALAEVITMPALEGFGGGVGGAYCMWRGRHLPVVGPDVLGAYLSTAGAADLRAPGLLAVLEHDGLALGVPVHAVLELGLFDPARAHAATPGAINVAVYDHEGVVGLIDTAALFARCPETALSKDGAPRAAADAKPGVDNDVACIVFEADGMGAAPIGIVEQVLALDGPVGATMPWEGRAIAMRDLRPAPARGGRGHVLVVRGAAGAAHVACVVTRVHLMIPAGTGRMYRMGAAGGRTVEFITTGDGVERASYRMIDLAAPAA